MRQLELSSHRAIPVVRLALQDRYDLGAEFFRWEFATAVAGSVLGINPFDQPDVELAKQRTQDALNEYEYEYEYEAGGELRQPEAQESIDSLLRDARPGRYLAIMAFCESTGEVDLALEEFRRAVVERYHVATTLGYGPRFLHSTGQLHKGGPDSGLFLQLTVDHAGDIPIPGDPYTFGVLADAQAVGDLRALKEARATRREGPPRTGARSRDQAIDRGDGIMVHKAGCGIIQIVILRSGATKNLGRYLCPESSKRSRPSELLAIL